jgi:hypothetical protein
MTNSSRRKRSENLIEGEAYRRIMAGEAPATLGEFAHQLLNWFQATYPHASPIKLTAIEERIRETWQRRHEMIRGGDP